MWLEAREFAQHQSLSLCEYLEHHARETLQLDVRAPVFHHLLAAGKALLVFDGLDELLSIRDRGRVRDIVNRLARRYPSVRILVTSREVGYWEAPLDDDVFTTLSLPDFTVGQVLEYAKNWFKLTSAPSDRIERAEAFMLASAPAQDIRTNPLMLGLMCALYHDEHHLPLHRRNSTRSAQSSFSGAGTVGETLRLWQSTSSILSR